MSGAAETSVLLAWLLTQECVSEIEIMPYVNTVNVYKSGCTMPKAVKAQVIPVPEPRQKPAIKTKSKPKAKAKRKRSSACGSKRQVWRTLKSGRKKYRCR